MRWRTAALVCHDDAMRKRVVVWLCVLAIAGCDRRTDRARDVVAQPARAKPSGAEPAEASCEAAVPQMMELLRDELKQREWQERLRDTLASSCSESPRAFAVMAARLTALRTELETTAADACRSADGSSVTGIRECDCYLASFDRYLASLRQSATALGCQL